MTDDMNKIGAAVLPWAFTAAGWHFDESVLRAALTTISKAGFDGVPIDIPTGMPAAQYAAILAEYGLEPGPGYFIVGIDESKPLRDVLDEAKRHRDVHLELGMHDTFVAADMSPARRARPAIGADFDEDRLARIIDRLSAVAGLLSAGGVTPALHQHIAGWIETEEEVEAVLAAVPAHILAFGPDTGHLRWAGIEPADIISRHRDRVRGIHLKDVHVAVAEAARADGTGYVPVVMGQHLWAEPGRGDIDFGRVLELVSPAHGYRGWYVIEIDVPDVGDVDASIAYCGEWADAHLRTAGR